MRFDAVMLRWLLACTLLAVAQPNAAHAADAPTMRALQVSPHAWYVQGESALGSSANRNFISNAGFVVTPAGVVVVDALGSVRADLQLTRDDLAYLRQTMGAAGAGEMTAPGRGLPRPGGSPVHPCGCCHTTRWRAPTQRSNIGP